MKLHTWIFLLPLRTHSILYVFSCKFWTNHPFLTNFELRYFALSFAFVSKPPHNIILSERARVFNNG